MKKQNIRLILVCVIALVFSGCATSNHSRDCDYKVVYGNYGGLPGYDLESQIRKAASDGWKVVSSGGGDDRTFAILCRPK